MDIVKAFAAAGLATCASINIQGTAEKPLFHANQIDELLGMANIRKVLSDFDDDEKRGVTT